MAEWTASMAQFVIRHAGWAGPVFGLLTFGESLAVVGLFIPATTLMIAVGGLVGSGLLDLAPVLGWGIAGALAGDWLSYLAGRWIGPTAWRRWPLNRHRSSVARARLFFRRFGFASVFVGRFLGPLRAMVPLVAGVMRMRTRSFQLANCLSAILWVPGLLAPGFLAARAVPTRWTAEAHVAAIVVASLVVTAVATIVLGVGLRRTDRKRAHRKRIFDQPRLMSCSGTKR